jgi:signal transduction histidine kinase/CheY-like chemotaxis protein
MATILVVDDKPISRQFLTTLLGYRGHRLNEAADGAQALRSARKDRPDLVITDILMPTMDGYELVRQLRSDPAISRTPVIFYTATYHQKEAQGLARACGVAPILSKPSEPQEILQEVDALLGVQTTVPAEPALEEFDREHLRVITDKLSKKVDDLESANLRLAALLEIGQRMASTVEREALLCSVCSAAREIAASRFSAIGVFEGERGELRIAAFCGADVQPRGDLGRLAPGGGVLPQLFAADHPLRLADIGDEKLLAGLPRSHFPTRSFLGMPLRTSDRSYGVLYLLEKLGAEEFTSEDEQIVGILGAQSAVAYENLCRYEELRCKAEELNREVQDRTRAEEEVRKLNEDLELRVAVRTAELSEVNCDLEAFASSVAHDLRAPLRHLNGFGEILKGNYGAQLAPEAKRYLDLICEGNAQMGRLIDDLLNLSRISRNQVCRKTADLNSILADVLRELEPETAGRHLEWKIESLPSIDCDPGLIRQVLMNLVSNAVKYTRPRPSARIEVGSSTRGGECIFFVRDNGVGFDMRYATKLFGVFQRLHGVGLAVVHKIVHKHGGRVWAEAERDKGACFTSPWDLHRWRIGLWSPAQPSKEGYQAPSFVRLIIRHETYSLLWSYRQSLALSRREAAWEASSCGQGSSFET